MNVAQFYTNHRPSTPQPMQRERGVWSPEEHDRFLAALRRFPRGPWRAITDYIGTRSIRQVQTHAQKYQEKVSRRLRGIPAAKKLRLRQEHRIDHEMLGLDTLISVPADKLHRRRASSDVLHERDGILMMTMTADLNSPYPMPLSQLILEGEDLLDDTDCELPSLGESLDFFIERFSE